MFLKNSEIYVQHFVDLAVELKVIRHGCTVVAELHGSPQGAIPALAERLGLDRRLVGRWASGTAPIPAAAPLETGWRRDEWLVAEGPAQAGASTSSTPDRHVFVVAWSPSNPASSLRT